jgi:transposase-like protein
MTPAAAELHRRRSSVVAAVSEMTRQNDISPQYLFTWRKAARAGLLSLPADKAPLFVPVVTKLRGSNLRGPTAITIEIGGALVRAASGVDPAWLRDVLRASLRDLMPRVLGMQRQREATYRQQAGAAMLRGWRPGGPDEGSGAGYEPVAALFSEPDEASQKAF